MQNFLSYLGICINGNFLILGIYWWFYVFSNNQKPHLEYSDTKNFASSFRKNTIGESWRISKWLMNSEGSFVNLNYRKS